MKRSKIFLGITASLLAVAGIAAAKHRSSVHLVYWTRYGCTLYELVGVRPIGTVQILLTDGLPPHTTYGGYLTSQCIVPAFPE